MAICSVCSPLNAQTVGTPPPPPASAAQLIPWPNREFLVIAQGRNVADVISELGEQQGIKVLVSPTVQGVMSGRFSGRDPAQVLDHLARAFNLMWIYHQGILFVYGTRDVRTAVRTLYFADTESAIRVLSSLGIVSSEGSVSSVPGSRLLMISGPPEFVRIVDNVLASLDTEQEFRQRGEVVIEVFPLKYAWAYDVTLSGSAIADDGTLVEGVATVLNRLVNGGGNSGNTGASFSTQGVARPVPGVLNAQELAETATLGFFPGNTNRSGESALEGGAPSGAAGSPGTGSGQPATEGGQPGGQPTSQPSITADVRRNAVVIRDIRENMDFYRAAIEKLDVPTRVIEITAAIVDVQTGLTRSLGLNTVAVGAEGIGLVGASATGSTELLAQNPININIGTTTPGDSDDNDSETTVTPSLFGAGTDGSNQPNILASGVFGTTQIVAALNMLEGENKAKILSRPTVLTLDNFAATIARQETFFVTATGQYVSNLFNVSAGLTLQVVPHIIPTAAGEEVYLQVKIEDGALGSQTVGQLPTVTQSVLTTQSVVKEGQSLLIGGLYYKVDQDGESGYPWLRKIPLLGSLFSVKNKNKSVVERLFLITPKIVDLSDIGPDFSQFFHPSPVVEDAMARAEGEATVIFDPSKPPRARPVQQQPSLKRPDPAAVVTPPIPSPQAP